MSDENVPMDVTAMLAESVIRAALAWRYEQRGHPALQPVEWRLYEACNHYGDKYKGLRGQ